MSRHQQQHQSGLIKFLQLKRYQYEVTFSLYMLTPVEKIVFNTFLFIFLSLLIIAVSFYLPHHIAIIGRRAWWYYAGDSTTGSEWTKGAVSETLARVVDEL